MYRAARIALRAITGPAAAPGEIRPLVFRAFALFIFSIPFEAVFSQEQSVFSLTKMTGLLLFLVCLTQPRECFRRIPVALWLFAGYAWVFVLVGFFQEARYQEEMFGRFFTLLQMLMLFWISYNILSEDKSAAHLLLPYAFGCVLIAILQLTNVTSTVVENEQPMRVSFFGEDPNGAASVLALGILALVGRFYVPLRVRWYTALLLLAPLAIVFLSMVSTASRGGMLALLAGLVVLGLGQGSQATRLRNAALLVLLLLVGLGIVIQNEVALERWQSTLQEGSSSGRTDIFQQAFRMFAERPILGWGPVRHAYELGARMHYLPQRDTHNMLLWLLTEVGLVGTIPYLAAVVLCAIAAWRARRTPHGILPLAMLVTVFVINTSLSWQNRKPHWILLAYALASGVQFMGYAVKRSGGSVSRALPPQRGRLARWNDHASAPLAQQGKV